MSDRRGYVTLAAMDLFDARTYGPQPDDRQLSAWHREWHRHARWLRSHHWSARLVIVTAVAYLALVFGILFGVGIRGF